VPILSAEYGRQTTEDIRGQIHRAELTALQDMLVFVILNPMAVLLRIVVPASAPHLWIPAVGGGLA